MANAILRRVRMLSDDPTRFPTGLRHLQMLEAESISIIREAVAECERPVMLYSIGKDSSVLLHLALKAFCPARLPFPLLHVDTTWKFREMIAFREQTAARLGLDLIVHVNQDGVRQGISPFSHGSAVHTDIMKTQALRQALDLNRFDAAFGGARRDEEKSRAKERIFSFRNENHNWNSREQRPEPWNMFNARKNPGQSFRVFPLSNWTELDVWQYILSENIPMVAPLTVCEERDPKGLYRKARQGQIANFTGLDSPYEPPENPEVRLDTSVLTIEQTVAGLVDYLERGGKLRSPD
jgi:sulfate adenylyltransferase subunit 2